jgi:virulence-associated protein VagC
VSTAEVVDIGGAQIVKLPEGYRFNVPTVSVRQEGEAMVLEPLHASRWPEGFFDAIRIDDPKFVRQDQGAISSMLHLTR